MMIAVPSQVTAEVAEDARAGASRKKRLEAIGRVRLDRHVEGLSAQVLHVGPYSAESPTIQSLHAFIAEQGLVLSGKHHEIYLNDPRRVAAEKMRTILRQPVTRPEA